MRIIAGMLRGRHFDSPSGRRTHPMSEKMRGALSNVLGDISGLSVLDCFGGSGALSFEAASRGAAQAVVVEINKAAHKVIGDNIQKLGLEAYIKVIHANVSSWSDANPDAQFDVVLCDSPYDNPNLSLLQKLTRHVKTGGVVVYSLPPKVELSLTTNYQLLSTRSYGDAQLVFYRRTP